MTENNNTMKAVIITPRKAPATIKRDTLTLADLQALFLSETDVKPSSRQTYGRAIRPFFAWVEREGLTLANITRAEVLRYRESLIGEGLSVLTIGVYLVAVRKFYEWAESRKFYPNVAKGVKPPRRVEEFKKEPLNAGQAVALLQQFKGNPDTLRDFALITVQLNTGLRLISLTLANISDIRTKDGRKVLYYQSKGHSEKDRFVILNAGTLSALGAYLETRPKVKENEPLFVSCSNRNQGGRLTTRTLSGIAKKALEAVGISGREFTAHSLRHTFGTLAIEHGANLAEVQNEMGHTSPVVTQRYVRKAEERLRLKNANVSGILQNILEQ